MSRLDTDFKTAAWPSMAYHAGQSVKYTPPGGPPVTLTAVLGKATDEAEIDIDGQFARIEFVATVSRDPAVDQGGIADPVANAIVRVGGTDYTVVRIGLTDALADLHLVLTEMLQHVRPGYYRERS